MREKLRREKSTPAVEDDIIDAYAAIWAALRILHHRAEHLPVQPPIDAMGLRMEIWY